MASLLELFCNADDFCQIFESFWNRQQLEKRLKSMMRSSLNLVG